jgi:hypothetical protein
VRQWVLSPPPLPSRLFHPESLPIRKLVHSPLGGFGGGGGVEADDHFPLPAGVDPERDSTLAPRSASSRRSQSLYSPGPDLGGSRRSGVGDDVLDVEVCAPLWQEGARGAYGRLSLSLDSLSRPQVRAVGPLDLKGRPRCLLCVAAVMYVGFSQVARLRATTALRAESSVNGAGLRCQKRCQSTPLRAVSQAPAVAPETGLHS